VGIAWRLTILPASYFRCCGPKDRIGMEKNILLETVVCGSVGKSVSRGHVKSNTTSGIDMLDLGALDDVTVVWPRNGDYPLLVLGIGTLMKNARQLQVMNIF